MENGINLTVNERNIIYIYTNFGLIYLEDVHRLKRFGKTDNYI